MSSCEQELQELVRQIDIMVKSRESQLRQQTKRVQKQLESKTKECLQQKTTLDENFKKVISRKRYPYISYFMVYKAHLNLGRHLKNCY